MGDIETVDLSQYGARLRADSRKRRTIVKQAMYKAALEGLVIVAADTPVDRGRLRNAWDVERVDDGADLFNDAPYAGVVEAGSRPHTPPFKPILRWVVRNFGLNLEAVMARRAADQAGADPDQAARQALQNARRSLVGDDTESASSNARAMAWSIVKNIEENGTEPVHMVKNNLPRLRREVEDAVEDVLSSGS